MTALIHAPLVSCDVESFFSQYKNILLYNHRKFNFQNLIYTVFIKCNSDVFINFECFVELLSFVSFVLLCGDLLIY